MSEEIKGILNKFDKVLENYELDKKFKQFSVDSICHLFPNEMLTIKNTITSLQHKVEQLEKELQITANNCKQLENIRKEAIEYINKNWGHWCSNHYEYATETINILNKGDNNVKNKK